MIYWFFLLGNSAFGNGLNGHTGVELCLCTVSLCLLVRRQLDRLYSIASQCSLTLKVTGTLNELVINIFTISFNFAFFIAIAQRNKYPISAAMKRIVPIATADLPHFSQDFLGRPHQYRHFHTMRQSALRNTPSDVIPRKEQ